MSYQLRHLQHTINYIVNKLQYADTTLRTRQLSRSDKKWLAEELYVAIYPLQARNPKNIAINSANARLADFFGLLAGSHIQFPSETTYLLKRGGISYECHNKNRTEIYNREKMRNKVSARRSAELAELSDRLNELSIDEDEHEFDSLSDEITYTPNYATLGDFMPQTPKVVSPIYTRHMNAKL
ncbi:MAG: hypothetical protein AB7I18_05115 [Candidatus Berkiella sp.]